MSYLINKKQCIFLTALIVYLSVLILEISVLGLTSAFKNASKYVRYVCYLLAVIKILMDFYDKKNILKICIVALLVGITVMQMSTNTYLFYLLIIVAAKDVNCRKIVQCTCFVQATALIVFVAGSQLGIVENYLFIQSGNRYRYGLGFLYATYAPMIFFFVIMSYLYLRKERMRLYEFIVLEAINYWFFVMTNTRFCFYLSTLMLIYVFIMRYFWQNRKGRIRKNRGLILTPAVICVGSIFLQYFYNSEKAGWKNLNEFLNDRLRLGRAALDQYSITWFGQDITWIGNAKTNLVGEYNYVDCSYLKILLDGGIVFLILIIAAYTYMMYVAVKINDFYLQTVMLFILIFCIMESRLVYMAFNPFLLLAATAFRTRDLEDLCRKEPILIPRFKMRSTQIRFKDRDWVNREGASWKKII